ncbi:hypothetical protein [Streptomyces sp. NPDC048527]
MVFAWAPAVEPDGENRDAVLDGDPEGRPKGTRLIVREERPHPSTQLQ